VLLLLLLLLGATADLAADDCWLVLLQLHQPGPLVPLPG
jgi:hypothetical protein